MLPTPSAQRLQRGLPGYLILFAPHAFAPQRQYRPRDPPSPPVFLLISAHFTATPGIPVSPKEASSRSKEVYNPKAVIPHAASLHQACAHCAIFPTAASRRSLGRVSVPVWPVALSGRLPVVATVGHHPTVKLIGRGPTPYRQNFPPPGMHPEVLFGIRPSFPGLSQSTGQVTHVLLTRSPLTHPKMCPFDLHVLSTPPAFVL